MTSMAAALRQLGYKVYDFAEHLQLHMEDHLEFFEGRTDSTQLLELYKDVEAITDPLATTLWYTFFRAYPEAKVILMLRDSPETWLRSLKKMLDALGTTYPWYSEYIRWFSETRRKYDTMIGHTMVRNSGTLITAQGRDISSGDDLSDENAMSQYILHNAAVQHLVPADQLLVHHVGDGWEPLCQFLGKPVPDAPFPRENVGGESGGVVDTFGKMNIFEKMDKEMKASFMKIGAGLTAVLGMGIY